MEKEIRPSGKKHFLKLVLIAVLLFLAMYLCAAAGYRFVRNSAPQEESLPGGAQDINQNSMPETSKTPFNLPSHASENSVAGADDSTAASLPQQDILLPADNNDYLVIAENGTVNLYILTKNGSQIFSKSLEISPDALMPEDRARLEEGIILESEDNLASLLEDYTS